MSASDEHDSGGSEEKGMSDLPGAAAFATMGLSVAVISESVYSLASGGRRLGPRPAVAGNRTSIGDGRRRGERCEASPAFPLENPIVRARKPPYQYTSTVTAPDHTFGHHRGFVAFVIALFFARRSPPWASSSAWPGDSEPAIPRSPGVRALNFRRAERQGRSSSAGRQDVGRLAVMTVIILALVWLDAPLGIGIVAGLVLYQIVFVINVMRIVASQGRDRVRTLLRG